MQINDDKSTDAFGDILIRVQALVDNELPAEHIDEVLARIASDRALSAEYAAQLKLKQKLRSGMSRVPDEWLRNAERRVSRRITRGSGLALLIGSYALLLGYAIYSLFTDPGVPLIVAVLSGTLVLGVAFLLINAIADRVRESRTDRYKEIVR